MGMKVPKGSCQVCLAKTEGGARRCPEHRRPPKYRATRATATIEGKSVRFDSKKEERRFADLCFLQSVRQISLLSRQPRFRLAVNGVHVCDYVGDFQYYDHGRGRMVVEDAKGLRTRAYRIKAKLFRALAGYEITEV